jgi:hypothetical protein
MKVSGIVPSPKDDRDWQFTVEAAAPPKIKPEVMLKEPTYPVHDQGHFGTCGGHSGAQWVETEMKYPNLSPLFLWSHTHILRGDKPGEVPECAGVALRDVCKALAKVGCCCELRLPYARMDGKVVDTNTHHYLGNARFYKIPGYSRVNNLTEIQVALTAGKSVLAGIYIPNDFWSRVWVRRGYAPKCIGDPEMGHGIQITGHSNQLQMFRVKNSWGKRGQYTTETGHTWLRYDFIAKYFMEGWVVSSPTETL